MLVHQRDHGNVFGSCLIQNRKWEPSDEPSPDCPRKNGSSLRGGDNLREHMLYLAEEIIAKSSGARVIKIGCLDQFLFSQWMENNISHRITERAFANACSAGIPSTFPVESSSARRNASTVHRVSASASTGS